MELKKILVAVMVIGTVALSAGNVKTIMHSETIDAGKVCSLTNFEPWFISIVSGIVSGLILSFLGWRIVKSKLKRNWNWIEGEYEVTSLQTNKPINQEIEIKDDPKSGMHFTIKSIGGNGVWSGDFVVEEFLSTGHGSFIYERDDLNAFGVHEYLFDKKNETIYLYGMNHGTGTEKPFRLKLTKK